VTVAQGPGPTPPVGVSGAELAVPSEAVLSSVLREFARTMLTDFPIQAILDRLVERIVDVLPVTSAGVTLISSGEAPHHIAASDLAALRFVELQTTFGEGPCLAAYETGLPVLIPDLARDTSFPNFTPPALEAGLAAVFTFPLHGGDERLGALDLYRETAGPLSHSAMDAAETLADVTAAYIINARARIELLEASDRSRMLALHDALTGLPNRVLFLERLTHAIDRGARSERVSAVLFADLDGFKAVNDRHGHLVGDELLVQVARRLEAVVRPADTLARISGDEFVVLCEDLDMAAEADDIASRLVAAMDEPFLLSCGSVSVGVSVGVAESLPGHAPSVHLLERADRAMYRAKRGGGGHQFSSTRRPAVKATTPLRRDPASEDG
jgi:diguanylate cyclase (GGDEF)-like protein